MHNHPNNEIWIYQTGHGVVITDVVLQCETRRLSHRSVIISRNIGGTPS